MKKILIATAAFIGTLLIGFIIGRSEHFRDATKMVQIDTTVVYDTVRYSKLQLKSDTYTLDIPRINKVFVLVPMEKTDTIIKEDKVSMAMEREFRFTETEDVQIWHSGIDSTIDSLNVFKKEVVISKTETTTLNPSPWRYSVSVGLDYMKMDRDYLLPNIGAEIGYKRISLSAEAGLSMDRTINVQSYWKIGFKYTIFGR